jgi:small subunit ribosomal protein S3
MGRKTQPKILRITATTREWDGKWFSDRRVDYRENLQQDLIIREYLAKNLRMASISRVEIVRDQNDTVLTIHTSRPAMVIGRGGSGIEGIQKGLKKQLPKNKFRINVQEIRNPDTDAAAVATQVVDQLERRMPYRRVLKQSVQRTRQAGAIGVRIALAGRLNGAEIARTEWLSDGNVPLHTLRADVDYAAREAITTYGTIGVKVWINRGDLLEETEQEEKKQERRKTRKSKGRRRKSLAEKAAAQKKSVSKKK